MSSGVSSLPSGPAWTKVQAHCCPITRTCSSAGGMVCLTATHTRIAATMITASHRITRMWGMLIQRLRCSSVPVMYCARTPSRARKRKMSQKNMPWAAKNHTPTSTVTSQIRPSISPAKLPAPGTPIMSVSSAGLQDEQHDRAHEQHGAHNGDDEGPARHLLAPMLVAGLDPHVTRLPRSFRQRPDVGDHVQHRLVILERRGHRGHLLALRVGRIVAPYVRLELVERPQDVPVRLVHERRGAHGLVPHPVRSMAHRAHSPVAGRPRCRIAALQRCGSGADGEARDVLRDRADIALDVEGAGHGAHAM